MRPPTPTVVLEGGRAGGAALLKAPWRCLTKAPWGCRRRSGGEGEIALSVLDLLCAHSPHSCLLNVCTMYVREHARLVHACPR